jgi:putative hydrolase of the HAD superfamily
VLFDAAGTLFRVRGSVGVAYARVAARYGVAIEPAEIEARFRAAFRSMPPLCFPGVAAAQLPECERRWWKQVVVNAFSGARFTDFEAFFAELFAYFAGAEAWETFTDVEPTLTALRAAGVRLGIVSNFDGRLLTVCDGLRIAPYFQTIVMSGRAGYAKPDPRIFATALGQLGVAAGETVHVGDSEAEDAQGARAAGIRAVLIQRDAASAAVSSALYHALPASRQPPPDPLLRKEGEHATTRWAVSTPPSLPRRGQGGGLCRRARKRGAPGNRPGIVRDLRDLLRLTEA